MQAPVPSDAADKTLQGGMTIDGIHLPAGTTLGTGAYIHRFKDAFGPDAKEFRPERWIDATEEQKILYERNMMCVPV